MGHNQLRSLLQQLKDGTASDQDKLVVLSRIGSATREFSDLVSKLNHVIEKEMVSVKGDTPKKNQINGTRGKT
ncbi:MAG: hypothetical protein Q8P49_02945 [Candidatus Liptonbacteria bacterium]|nr:hypothetical protein [Candidatus Liptonbacteria bacterium]